MVFFFPVLYDRSGIPQKKQLAGQLTPRKVYRRKTIEALAFASLIEEMKKHQQYERVFDHFDINGDRKISPSELQQCVEAIGRGEQLSLAEAEEAVEFLDSDGDGLLGFDDFVKFVEEGGDEEKVNDLKEAFKMYVEMDDGCGCGCITPKSLRRMLSRLGQYKSVDECKVMIAHFDLNGDGVLNFDEFRIMML